MADKDFTHKNDLIIPMRCSQCVKTFPQKCTLRRHMLIHIGEKPHQCSQCEKAFVQKSLSYNTYEGTH